LASNVGKLAEQVDPDDLPRMMQAYADALRPWATRVATKMVAEVDARNVAALSKLDVSSRLRRDLRDVDVDFAGLQLIERQVEFILDIPRRAAERASEDYDPVAAARSSARRVARLAVSEASTVLTKARATSVGSTHYVWRTARDSKVRESHRRMEGAVCEWANPPAVPGEGNHHAGEIWGCRCRAEPIINDPYAPAVRGKRRR